MGLLDYLTSTALDEDYAYVAMRDADRDASARETPARPGRCSVGPSGASAWSARS